MLEFLKSWWKHVVSVVGVLAVITSILAFDARFAKTADMNKELEGVKIEVASAIQEVKKSLQLQQDITRMNSINDQMMKIKVLLKTYPKDRELKEDYESLKQERIRLQQKIEGGVR